MTKKLNYNSLRLLISNTLFRGGKNVFQIFLNIFLWKETGDIQIIALFNIFFFIAHYVGIILNSFFVKYGYRRIIHFLSFFGLIISYLFIIFLGEQVINNIYIVGIIFGFFNGSYYMNYNINQFDLTTFKNRGNFEGIKKSLKIISKMFYPALFGTIISFYNINIAFVVGIFLFISAYFVGDVKFDYSKGKTKYVKFFKILKDNKKIVFSILGTFFFTLAFSIPLIELIIPILIYNEVGTELKLGFSLSFLSVISIAIMYLFGKMIDYKHYNNSLIVLTILYIFALLGLVLLDNYSILLGLSGLIIALISLYGICTSVITNNSLHSIKNFNEY
ncbi:MAG: MFS transporter, partial [Candidatus Gracilibacteria bacterium]